MFRMLLLLIVLILTAPVYGEEKETPNKEDKPQQQQSFSGNEENKEKPKNEDMTQEQHQLDKMNQKDKEKKDKKEKDNRRKGDSKFNKFISDSVKVESNIGTVTLTDPNTQQSSVYNLFEIRPEISFGKTKCGLILPFYIGGNNRLDTGQWDSLDKIIDKLWLNYGAADNKLYGSIGSDKYYSLGYGIIMDNYNNRLEFPDIWKVGGLFGVNMNHYGINLGLSDIKNPLNNIVSARAFYHPFHLSPIESFNKFEFGITAVADTNPNKDSSMTGDGVLIYGIDMGLPIILNRNLILQPFVDIGQMKLGDKYVTAGSKSDGMGYTLGIKGTSSVLNFKTEFRTLDNNFIPGYFDMFYEVDRSSKGFTVSSDNNVKKTGLYMEVARRFFNFIDVTVAGESYNIKDDYYPWVYLQIEANPNFNAGEFSIGYMLARRGFSNWDELLNVRGNNTISAIILGYKLTNQISLHFNYQQTFNLYQKPINRTNLEAHIKFDVPKEIGVVKPEPAGEIIVKTPSKGKDAESGLEDEKAAQLKYGEAQGYYDMELYAKARVIYEDIINNYPVTRWAELAQYKKALCYINTVEVKLALDELNRFINTYPKSNLMPLVKYRVALAYYVLGNLEDAVKEFKSFIDKYPGNKHIKEIEKYLKEINQGD